MRQREKWYTHGLLPRMEARLWKDGKTVSYRYISPSGKALPLGNNKQRAILKVAQMSNDISYGTFENAWVIYQDSIYWKRLTEGSKKNYIDYAQNINKVFGQMHVAAIKPMHIAKYLRSERANAPIQANKEVSLMSNVFNVAIEHGLLDLNPCKEVKKNPEMPRDVIPDSQTLNRFLSWLSTQTPQRQIIAMAAEYASLAGSRQIEFLDLTWEQVDFHDKMIRLRRAKQKGGKKITDLIVITSKMGGLLIRLKALGRDCPFVFPNSQNTKYTSDGFRTMWQRSILSAIKSGIIKAEDRFTFHDLRAYYTTEHKKQKGALPDIHANPATTAKIYDRGKESRRSAL